MTNEWVEWHRQYDGPQPLARRLVVVQRLIAKALDQAAAGSIRVVSACAGDGRDLLGVLEHHRRAADVSAVLIELEPALVAAGRERAKSVDGRVTFVHADAGISDMYASGVPAEIVLLCGVFGNITDADVMRIIDHAPQLCAAGAAVIWTRSRVAPDLTPAIRERFGAAGFEEIEFVPVPDTLASVGMHRLAAPPQPLDLGVKMFTFLPKDQRPSQQRDQQTT